MQEAMERIVSIGMKSDKVLGIHVVEPNIEEFKKRIKQGYRFLVYSLDIRMLDWCCRQGLKKIKL
jgi:2-dehydro-3-deoxyglucarate aldolase